MNILFITTAYPNLIDPTKGLFNHYLARALAAEHRISVITPVPWVDEVLAGSRGGLPRAEVKDGIALYYPRYYYPPKLCRSWYGWFYWRSVRAVVNRVMAAEAPDFLLAFWVHPDGEAAIKAGAQRGLPTVLIAGGSDALLLAQQPRRRRCIARVLRAADAVAAVSSDLAAKIGALGVPPDKVHVWQRGIDVSVFSPGSQHEARQRLRMPTSVPVLLWVGRMVPVKGLTVLLQACALLRQRQTACHLYLVGDGPLRKALEAQSRSLSLDRQVSFLGPRLHDELPDWYRAADLTVLPSHSEGVPNVLRESVACGTPFVASRVGGIPELATVPGLRLVPPGDPTALAAALTDALHIRGRIQPLSTPLTSWDSSAEALVQILKPLVRQRATSCSSLCEIHS